MQVSTAISHQPKQRVSRATPKQIKALKRARAVLADKRGKKSKMQVREVRIVATKGQVQRGKMSMEEQEAYIYKLETENADLLAKAKVVNAEISEKKGEAKQAMLDQFGAVKVEKFFPETKHAWQLRVGLAKNPTLDDISVEELRKHVSPRIFGRSTSEVRVINHQGITEQIKSGAIGVDVLGECLPDNPPTRVGFYRIEKKVEIPQTQESVEEAVVKIAEAKLDRYVA